MSKLKNREEFEGLEERKGKGGKRRKKEKSDKTNVKISLRSLNDRNEIHKNREDFREGGGIFWLAGIYSPVLFMKE